MIYCYHDNNRVMSIRQLSVYENHGGYLLWNPRLGLGFYSPGEHKLVQDCKLQRPQTETFSSLITPQNLCPIVKKNEVVSGEVNYTKHRNWHRHADMLICTALGISDFSYLLICQSEHKTCITCLRFSSWWVNKPQMLCVQIG